jgi:hypothetical protein
MKKAVRPFYLQLTKQNIISSTCPFSSENLFFIIFDLEHSDLLDFFGWDTPYTYAPIAQLKVPYIDGSSAAPSQSNDGYFDLQLAPNLLS